MAAPTWSNSKRIEFLQMFACASFSSHEKVYGDILILIITNTTISNNIPPIYRCNTKLVGEQSCPAFTDSYLPAVPSITENGTEYLYRVGSGSTIHQVRSEDFYCPSPFSYNRCISILSFFCSRLQMGTSASISSNLSHKRQNMAEFL